MNSDIRIALLAFARMSGWVVAPVILGLFVGRMIDTAWGTDPYGLLVSLGVCFVASIVGIFREARVMRDDIDKS